MRQLNVFCFLMISIFASFLSHAQDLRNLYEFTNFEKYKESNTKYETPSSDEPRVVFMGNSITEAWVQVRPDFFNNSNFIGRGISGQTTPQMLLRFRKDVINLKPKVVVILAGINDIAQNTGYTPIDIIADNIMTMADIAKSHDIKVIICSVTPAIDFPWSPGLQPADKIIQLNKILEEYASQNDIQYVDYHSALKDENNGLRVPEFTSSGDLVHPNEAGYVVMEKLVKPAIDKALEGLVLSVNPFFSDHIVLQQQENVPVWGKAPAGQEVKVEGNWGAESTAVADENGSWTLQLKTPEAGGPHQLSISSTNTSIQIEDVMIGEVWLASGQSNMQMPLEGWPPRDLIQNSEAEIANAQYPGIRMFKVANKFSMEEENSFEGQWDVCTPENAADFSATAYFFARRLHQELNIPIGIIHSSWGGTPAESWTSRNQLKKLGDFDEIIKTFENPESLRLTNEWFERWEKTACPTEVEDWNHIDLNDHHLAQPEYIPKNWSTMQLTGRLDVYKGKEMDGAFWFRKTIELDDISGDYHFEMGIVDDTDVVFINGKKIGATSYDFMNPRKYPIPKSVLKKGKNTIAIRIIDTGGPGSISNGIKITNENEPAIILDGEWDYILSAEIFQGDVYHYDLSTVRFEERPQIIAPSPYSTPSSLFNAMIYPLIPYHIKGAIWYQGESNVGKAEQYQRLFPAMIQDWREHWNRDFPFYFVQIAPFRYNISGDENLDESQYLRDAQRNSLFLKKTGMVVTLDIGDNDNIHPANKQDVGQRLAGFALVNDYGKEGIASGPLYKSATVKGKKIIIEFDHLGLGLTTNDAELLGFEIAGADKQYVHANAKIVDNKVVVSASSVAKPKFVRYAWRDTSVGSLFNKQGLPASSFTTEN